MLLYARLLTIEALRSLARHKVRTLLAMLGNLIGVASVIWVVAIGRAATERSLAQLDQLGTNLVWVEAGSRNAAGVRTGSRGMTTLTAKDAQAIRDEVPLVAAVSENVDGRIQLEGNGRNWNTQFRGVAPEYLAIRSWQIARGGFFTDDDVRDATRVVVIGETVRRELFGDDEALGEQVRIHGALFDVIGVFAAKGQSATGQDQDDTIMMPWTTAMKRVVGKDQTWLDDVLCSATAPEDIAAAADQISSLLRQRHRIADGDDPDFNIRHPEDLIKARLAEAQALQSLLIVLAAIALVVGGIGIMNVMLAAVLQRTREIGIRVAVGARPSAIQVQFLGEALVITLAGGLLGVAAASAGAPLVEHSLGWTVSSPEDARAVAILVSLATGALFGFYPALRASRLDPVLALYQE